MINELPHIWELGSEIVLRQSQTRWSEGFSERNLKYIPQWVIFYSSDKSIGQQPVAQLSQIPLGHHLKITAKCQSVNNRNSEYKNVFGVYL